MDAHALHRGTALCALLAATIALSACGGDSSSNNTTASAGVQGGSEVAAEPVNSTGDNPFTPPVGKDMKGLEPPPGAVGMGGPASYRGGLPGLYGGTRNYATCDAEQLVVFLEQNPDKATAWAGTLGIPVTRIRRYVFGLTPVLLRTDTRVTNHGYVNGRATPIQAVLQAGTAVYVNHYGEPVIKCYCGNPLTRPTLYRTPVYIGTRWRGFGSNHITIINKSITIIDTFTLYDPRTGKTFDRRASTDGDEDTSTGQDLPAPMDPSTTPSAPPPTQQPPPDTTPSQPAAENPAASFSPNPGQQGDTFTLAASGFRPGATLDVTLVRPDGHVEHYPISVGGDGRGTYTFTNTQGVITGTYNATVKNPATGASASASVLVQPAGGGP